MTRPARPKRPAARTPAATDPLVSPAADALPGHDSPFSPAAITLVVAVTALGLRLWHVLSIRDAVFFDVLMGDAKAYDAWAQQIAGGQWIGTDVFYQAPLYPYFLGVLYAVFGHNLLIVRLVQALIGSASCVLIGRTAARVFGARAGLIAGLALAVYAPAIFLDSLLQKSVLDVFFVSLSLLMLSRAGRAGLASWVGLGLAMGALSLTRENALALVAVVALYALVGLPAPIAARLRALVVFGLAVAAVLLPVAVRNYAVGGGFYLTTAQFGPNFYIGNNPGADGTYASLRFGRGAPEYERQDATELAEKATGRTLTPADVSRYWTSQALTFITTQPGAWLTLTARKLVLLVNAAEMLDTESQETYADASLPLRLTGWFTHFGLLVPLALLGAIVSWRERQRLWVFYLLTLAYAASVVMFYVFARYRFPLVPMLVLFAAGGLASAAEWFRGRDPRARAMTAAELAVALIVTNWPVLSSTLMRAITETNLATALQGENRVDEAIAHYRRATEIQPDYAPAYNNLGTALRAKGQVDEAIATYRKAVDLAPDYPDAHYNLANALMDRGRADEAAQHFQVALKSMPDSSETRNNLGIALMNQGRLDEAIAAFRDALRSNPTSTKTLRNLANALDARGHTDEAVEALQEAIAIDPKDEAALYDLGSTMLEVGQLDAAIDAFRRALAVNPRSVEAHNNLGIALGSKGALVEAMQEFREALAIKPDFPDARRNLALAEQAVREQKR